MHKILGLLFLAVFIGPAMFHQNIKAQDTRIKQPKLRLAKEDKALRNTVNRGDWVAFGDVRDQSDSPIAGLTVELYDKDMTFDDLLGRTLTDAKGRFRILYKENHFKELTDNRPDLYLKVRNKKGKILYTASQVRFNAGKIECFHVLLKTNLILQPPVLKLNKPDQP